MVMGMGNWQGTPWGYLLQVPLTISSRLLGVKIRFSMLTSSVMYSSSVKCCCRVQFLGSVISPCKGLVGKSQYFDFSDEYNCRTTISLSAELFQSKVFMIWSLYLFIWVRHACPTYCFGVNCTAIRYFCVNPVINALQYSRGHCLFVEGYYWLHVFTKSKSVTMHA